MDEQPAKYKRFIDDAYAFCVWSLSQGRSSSFIAETLMHDLAGLHRDEPNFSLRVDGYRKEVENAKDEIKR